MSAPSITVLGGGESGVGSALLARAVGSEAWVSDAGTLKPALRAELEAARAGLGQSTAELQVALPPLL